MHEYLTRLHSMSPSLKRSIALQHFDCSCTIEICNRIMLDIYHELAHSYVFRQLNKGVLLLLLLLLLLFILDHILVKGVACKTKFMHGFFPH